MSPPPSVPPSWDVEILRDLYFGTDGAGWINASGWLSGEPCSDGWKGVSCCPDDYPQFDPDSGQCSGGAPPFTALAPGGGVYPDGCRAGTHSGTASDHARCQIVAIDLSANRLRGSLNESLCGLRALVVLRLTDNSIGGGFPSCLAQASSAFGSADLAHNEFDYDEDDPTQMDLIERCRLASGGLASCSGVPPLSCSAFGRRYQVRTDDNTKCVECDADISNAALAISAVVLVFVLLLAGYLLVLQRFQRLGERLDLWINTIAIFVCHLQTVSIIGTLKLSWPPSAIAIMQTAGINIFDFGAIRPECLLGETSGEGTYYYFVIGRFSLIIVLILGVGVVQALLKACSSRSGGAMRRTVRRVDQLEMIESVVLTFGLTTCWRGIFGMWEEISARHRLVKVGFTLGTLLFFVQSCFMLKYGLNIRALVTGASFGPIANLSQERLQLRLSFLTERFGAHAPYWQFVVWLRQFLLTLDVWVADLYLGPTGSAADFQGVVLAHAVVALLIFVAFWALQVRVQPYAFHFQNQIEQYLFAANVAVVALGVVWAYASGTSAAVEYLLVALLVTSLALGAVYICHQSRKAHLARRAELAMRANRFSHGRTRAAAMTARGARDHRACGEAAAPGLAGWGDLARADAFKGSAAAVGELSDGCKPVDGPSAPRSSSHAPRTHDRRFSSGLTPMGGRRKLPGSRAGSLTSQRDSMFELVRSDSCGDVQPPLPSVLAAAADEALESVSGCGGVADSQRTPQSRKSSCKHGSGDSSGRGSRCSRASFAAQYVGRHLASVMAGAHSRNSSIDPMSHVPHTPLSDEDDLPDLPGPADEHSPAMLSEESSSTSSSPGGGGAEAAAEASAEAAAAEAAAEAAAAEASAEASAAEAAAAEAIRPPTAGSCRAPNPKRGSAPPTLSCGCAGGRTPSVRFDEKSAHGIGNARVDDGRRGVPRRGSTPTTPASVHSTRGGRAQTSLASSGKTPNQRSSVIGEAFSVDL